MKHHEGRDSQAIVPSIQKVRLIVGIGKRGSCVVVEVAQLTKTGLKILD